jgi:hypothetical protein
MIGEPELEEIAGDDEAVPQGGDGIEKGEEGLFRLRGAAAEVRIPDQHETLADHRAKIGHAGRGSKQGGFDFPPVGGAP